MFFSCFFFFLGGVKMDGFAFRSSLVIQNCRFRGAMIGLFQFGCRIVHLKETSGRD